MLLKYRLSGTIKDHSPSYMGEEMNNVDFAKFNNKFSSSSNHDSNSEKRLPHKILVVQDLDPKQERESPFISSVSGSLTESNFSQSKSLKTDTKSKE
jgi:hypothetical protein